MIYATVAFFLQQINIPADYVCITERTGFAKHV
jgi:hypothetical protein